MGSLRDQHGLRATLEALAPIGGRFARKTGNRTLCDFRLHET